LVFVLGLALAAGSSQSASGAAHGFEITLPRSRTVRVPSPDGRWMLVASPFSPDHGNTLTLEDRRTGAKTVVKRYDRSIGVGWSPDSRAFFLNDAYGSNVEDAYVYWPGAAEPWQLDDILLKNDAKARAIAADHTYFQVRRWLNAKTVLVEYCGHDSGGAIVGGFDLKYRVELGEQEAKVQPLPRAARSVSDCSV
jgi:hypothetical protein